MLSIESLDIGYDSVEAVRGASCQVEAGELVGIIGSNGAGKSSLLHGITGVVKPRSGKVTFRGEDITGKRPEDIAGRGLILVPEGRQTFTWMTVEENLKVACTRLSSKEEGEAAIEDALDRFEVLRRFRERPAGALSGGEQQQLVIARALIASPGLLMLDEPSLGLAPKLVQQVFDILAQIQAEGIPVLLVEQNASHTVALADRVYVMERGTLSEAEPESLKTPELIRAYLGG